MKTLKLKLIKDVLKKDHKWLHSDFKKGDDVYLCTNQKNNAFKKKSIDMLNRW